MVLIMALAATLTTVAAYVVVIHLLAVSCHNKRSGSLRIMIGKVKLTFKGRTLREYVSRNTGQKLMKINLR
jgi:hypothetical protein